MFVLKPRPSNLRLETLARAELADALLIKPVERITFDFHLPYLLRADCPFKKTLRGLDGGYIDFAFSDAERTTIFSDKHELKSPYTLIRATLFWDHPRPLLRSFMNEPLATLTEFPLHLINGLLESYQLLTSDYAGRHLGPMELDYVPGEIWLASEPEPLKSITHHWRTEKDKARPEIDSDMWLYYSGSLLSDAPKWLATKLFNNARRAAYDHQWKNAFIDSVTCVEVLTSEAIRVTASTSAQSQKILQLRGLRRMMLDGIATHPNIVPKAQVFRNSVSEWFSHVYVTRNRIVHAGYSEINHDDVMKALKLTGDLASWLDDVVAG